MCSMDEHPAGEHLLVMSDETTGSPEVEFMKKTVVFYTIVARHGGKEYLIKCVYHYHVRSLWPQVNRNVEEVLLLVKQSYHTALIYTSRLSRNVV